MRYERQQTIGRHVVEEFLWAGKMVVYIDNRATKETFEEACSRLRQMTPHSGEACHPIPESFKTIDG